MSTGQFTSGDVDQAQQQAPKGQFTSADVDGGKPQDLTYRAGQPASGAGGAFPERSFASKLFDPNYKQADPTIGTSSWGPLMGHVAQSFDIVNLARNLGTGAVKTGDFAYGLGKDLLTNPNGPPLGEHSFFE